MAIFTIDSIDCQNCLLFFTAGSLGINIVNFRFSPLYLRPPFSRLLPLHTLPFPPADKFFRRYSVNQKADIQYIKKIVAIADALQVCANSNFNSYLHLSPLFNQNLKHRFTMINQSSPQFLSVLYCFTLH